MKRNTLIMLAVFVVLLLVVLVAENPFRGKKESEAPPLFPGFDSTAVAVIEVVSPGDSTRLEKTDGLWRVETQGGYPADPRAVGELIAKVRDMERGEIASRNPEKQSLYQVDGSVVRARLMGPDGALMANLFVGKGGPGYSGTYVRAAGSDEVVLAGGYLRGTFDKGTRGWRDRTIFDVDQNKILRFTTVRGDTMITVRTDDKVRWYISTPDSMEAKMSAVENVLRTFSTLLADEFGTDVSLEDAGLTKPWGTFTAHLEDGTDRVVLVGNLDNGSRWVKRPDKDMIFKVRTYRIRNLFQSVEELREMTPEEKAAVPPPE